MITETVYLLFWSLVISALSAPLFAWPVGRVLGKGFAARPGFLRLVLLCLLAQFSALVLHVLGGLVLGMLRPPIRPEYLSWLINAVLLAACFVFLAKTARHENQGRPIGSRVFVYRSMPGLVPGSIAAVPGFHVAGMRLAITALQSPHPFRFHAHLAAQGLVQKRQGALFILGQVGFDRHIVAGVVGEKQPVGQVGVGHHFP